MDILKFINLILFCLFFSSCFEKRCSEYSTFSIEIYDWNNKSIPKKAKIETYKKGSFFKEKINERYSSINISGSGVEDNNESILISVYDSDFFSFEISSKKDYSLILDDTLFYNISNIETVLDVDSSHHTMAGPTKSCVIKSLEINGQIIENPEILRFSRNTSKIIKK